MNFRNTFDEKSQTRNYVVNYFIYIQFTKQMKRIYNWTLECLRKMCLEDKKLKKKKTHKHTPVLPPHYKSGYG